MFKALIESANRFSGKMPPIGYDKVSIKWIIDLTDVPKIEGPYKKGVFERYVPVVGDRSGTVSEDNLKPALLVDKAKYALGIEGIITKKDKKGETIGNIDLKKAFLSLLQQLAQQDKTINTIITFLNQPFPNEIAKDLEKRKLRIKADDWVTFRVEIAQLPFDKKEAQNVWYAYLKEKYAHGNEVCSICGVPDKAVMRILPWQISLAGYSCPISSVNSDESKAFDSFGEAQLGNSPLCFDCSSKASQTLQYLINTEKHRAILVRDEVKKGNAKSPLKNIWAIFWLKEDLTALNQDNVTINFEELAIIPIMGSSFQGAKPPADLKQIKHILNLPWHAQGNIGLDKNRFLMAVISPNKSRLVLRDWFDESVSKVIARLNQYSQALGIVSMDGKKQILPTMEDLLAAIKPPDSKSSAADANIIRDLLQTAYMGASPPEALLYKAVERFRIPDKKDAKPFEKENQELRRMTLVAIMKLVLTYGTKEAETMVELDLNKKSQAYLCGVLLSVFEEIQLRHANWKLNSTLVDRNYGAASTEPATVFGNLIITATQSHMPKLRKEKKASYENMEKIMEKVMTSIDENGGIPKILVPKEQAEFGLGFYHQRAYFRKNRPS